MIYEHVLALDENGVAKMTQAYVSYLSLVLKGRRQVGRADYELDRDRSYLPTSTSVHPLVRNQALYAFAAQRDMAC